MITAEQAKEITRGVICLQERTKEINEQIIRAAKEGLLGLELFNLTNEEQAFLKERGFSVHDMGIIPQAEKAFILYIVSW